MTKKILMLLCFCIAFSAFASEKKMAELQNLVYGMTACNLEYIILEKEKTFAYLFGEEGRNVGNMIEINGPVIDLAKSDVDVNLVKMGKVELYKLDSSLAEVVDFWKERCVFSIGVATSKDAKLDLKGSQVAGKEDVFFRSPALDIDGKGYHVDYKNSTIKVFSEVKIIARAGDTDVSKILAKNGKLPKEHEFIQADSNSLFLDLKKNIIELTGDVAVRSEDRIIYCDKMVIKLDKGNKSAKGNGGSFNIGSSSAVLSEIVCSGNVKIEFLNNPANKSGGTNLKFFGYMDNERRSSQQMVYCAEDNSDKNQTLQIGSVTVVADNLTWKFGKDKHLVLVKGDVQIKDAKNGVDLTCERLTISLGSEKGKMVIKSICALDNVELVDKTNQLFCDNLRVFFKKQDGKDEPFKVEAYGNVKIINHSEDKDKGQFVLTCGRGFLYRFEHRAEFFQNVKVTDPRFALDSQKLFVFAKEIPQGETIPKMQKNVVPDRIHLFENLELDKIEAVGDVAVEQRNQKNDNAKAFGEKAVYIVKDKKIILSGDENNFPKVVKGTMKFQGRKGSTAVVDLDEESAEIADGGDMEFRELPELK